jgi:hypothetical protein
MVADRKLTHKAMYLESMVGKGEKVKLAFNVLLFPVLKNAKNSG